MERQSTIRVRVCAVLCDTRRSAILDREHQKVAQQNRTPSGDLRQGADEEAPGGLEIDPMGLSGHKRVGVFDLSSSIGAFRAAEAAIPKFKLRHDPLGKAVDGGTKNEHG
jgi:hypothetical protein